MNIESKSDAHTYITKGVCARTIDFEVEGNKVTKVKFESGCNGNLKGIGSLVEGMDVDTVIQKLRGTTCGGKGTSCPDQLAVALEEWKTRNS